MPQSLRMIKDIFVDFWRCSGVAHWRTRSSSGGLTMMEWLQSMFWQVMRCRHNEGLEENISCLQASRKNPGQGRGLDVENSSGGPCVPLPLRRNARGITTIVFSAHW
jgi:hypothetical protein